MLTAHSTVAAFLAWLMLSTVAGDPPQRRAPDVSRQRPPEGFACDRNNLTSYTGIVTRYTRQAERTVLQIRTDWDTTERVTLRHPGSDDPSAFYRIGGRPFTQADWGRIERSKSVLKSLMRASAWVCTDGKVMVDWDAPKE